MIDQALLDRATELLKETAHPQKIILLGSHARKDAREARDVDIRVIETEMMDRFAEMVRRNRTLSPLRIPVDFLVISQEMFNYWAETGKFHRNPHETAGAAATAPLRPRVLRPAPRSTFFGKLPKRKYPKKGGACPPSTRLWRGQGGGHFWFGIFCRESPSVVCQAKCFVATKGGG